jgi:hypothetical protein
MVNVALFGATRHMFSMRKTNAREQARLAPYFEV